MSVGVGPRRSITAASSPNMGALPMSTTGLGNTLLINSTRAALVCTVRNRRGLAAMSRRARIWRFFSTPRHTAAIQKISIWRGAALAGVHGRFGIWNRVLTLGGRGDRRVFSRTEPNEPSNKVGRRISNDWAAGFQLLGRDPQHCA